jgi:hypothetical protein
MKCVFAWQRHRGRVAGIDDGHTGAITFIQRFGGALNANVHFHSITTSAHRCSANPQLETQPGQQIDIPLGEPGAALDSVDSGATTDRDPADEPAAMDDALSDPPAVRPRRLLWAQLVDAKPRCLRALLPPLPISDDPAGLDHGASRCGQNIGSPPHPVHSATPGTGAPVRAPARPARPGIRARRAPRRFRPLRAHRLSLDQRSKLPRSTLTRQPRLTVPEPRPSPTTVHPHPSIRRAAPHPLPIPTSGSLRPAFPYAPRKCGSRPIRTA